MRFIVQWVACVFVLGLASMPLSAYLFQKFEDRGWLLSKALGLLLCGSGLWFLNVPRLIPFNGGMCWAVLAAFACVNWGAWWRWGRGRPNVRLCCVEEAAFLTLFLFFVYVVGFNPWIKGIEKFMDYGFLNSMLRSEWLPFDDIWMSGRAINYYYGSQYIMAFLAKLSGVPSGYAYNLMRATVAAFSVMLPFSIVYQMMRDKVGARSRAPWLAGAMGGFSVGLAGNGHYLLYGLFERAYQVFTGQAVTYWYPNSTRFISGTQFEEKNIHEFPAYASILGDLHAHYINTIFVLTLAALLYAWAQKREDRAFPLRASLCETALMGVVTGLFMWLNYWDYPIYLVVCGAVFFFHNLREHRPRYLRAVALTLLEAAVLLLCGRLAALPFTSSFRMISSEVRPTYTHSPLLQLAIVWGFPALVFAGFLTWLYCERRAARREGVPASLALPDLCVVLLGLCAAGLVAIPEFVYVVDIYSEMYYRSNTMFKLTYQAFILFGLCAAYISVRAFRSPNAMIREYGLWGIALLLAMSSYSLHAGGVVFGDVLQVGNRIGTDGSFIERFYPEDAGAVAWMNENIEGQPVVLEAPGGSESDYERVSVSTGLPTVIGWRTHEWLWNGDVKLVNRRNRDVKAIYTSSSPKRVSTLLKRYKVSYVYVGKMEYEKYPGLDPRILKGLGEAVYSADKSLLIKVR